MKNLYQIKKSSVRAGRDDLMEKIEETLEAKTTTIVVRNEIY